MKKVFKRILIVCFSILILFICLIFLLKILKPRFFTDIFPKISYTIKDVNVVKNYKDYKINNEKRKILYDQYRGDFANKNSKTFLDLGSGHFYNQGVHPDVLKIKNKNNEDRYWMAYTPYPYNRDKYENPHIVTSTDGMNFKTPREVKNPLVPTPDDHSDGGHLSDTDMIYDNGKFMMYYVYNKKGVLGGTKFYLIDSKDGISWSKPQVVYDTREGYSPTVVRDTNDFKMWHIESEGSLVVSNSVDGYKWSTFKKCNINLGEWLPWHIDIQKTSKGYEGFVCARNPKLKTRALLYMISEDGVNFKISTKPILFPTENAWDNKEIYRSSFIKENNKYRVWYSARGDFYKWHIGYTEYTENEIKSLKMQ